MGSAEPIHATQPATSAPIDQVGDKLALADPGLPLDHDHPAPARPEVGQPGAQRGPLDLPPDGRPALRAVGQLADGPEEGRPLLRCS